MKPEVRVFTKDRPCNKSDIWNCFRGKRGFRKVQVDEAHSIVGVNAPKNMLKNGYVEVETARNREQYVLTDAGQAWLTKGILGFLKRHPDEAGSVKNLPKSLAA